MKRKCLDCPALIGDGSRCPRCQERYRSGASRSTFARHVKARDGGRCRRCGAAGANLKAHHIVPLAEGGADTEANMVTLCERCHRIAHATSSPVKM